MTSQVTSQPNPPPLNVPSIKDILSAVERLADTPSDIHGYHEEVILEYLSDLGLAQRHSARSLNSLGCAGDTLLALAGHRGRLRDAGVDEGLALDLELV